MLETAARWTSFAQHRIKSVQILVFGVRQLEKLLPLSIARRCASLLTVSSTRQVVKSVDTKQQAEKVREGGG